MSYVSANATVTPTYTAWVNCYTTTNTSTSSNVLWINTGTNQTGQMISSYNPPAAIQLGNTYAMPDGSKLHIDDLGNYRIDDSKARVTYKANRVREFNPYINSSDLLERFINEVGVLDSVDQGEVLRLPIEAFINWLILQAAKRDGDRMDNLPSVESALPQLALPNPARARRPQCGTCGRFIRKAWAQARIAFCSPEHMQTRLTRMST